MVLGLPDGDDYGKMVAAGKKKINGKLGLRFTTVVLKSVSLTTVTGIEIYLRQTLSKDRSPFVKN